MEITSILNIVLTLIVIFLIWKTLGEGKKGQEKEGSTLSILASQIQDINKQINEQTKYVNDSTRNQSNDLQKSVQNINEQITKHLINVTKGVTEANEASKQVLSIADQLKNLEKVLKHQKQRGTLGEASLELILSNILPPTAYKLQYKFKDGKTVDAVIQTKEGIIPVDAKFSLDNFARYSEAEDAITKQALYDAFAKDLEKRIDETAQYIKTGEDTLPFAFMFIPAEGIYYDLLTNEKGSSDATRRNLLDYAYQDKKVIIVSPTTFAAYLQSVLYGFRAFKIEESAQQIQKQVAELQKHLRQYEEYHMKLGKQLGATVNHFNDSHKAFQRIDKDVEKITGKSIEVEPLKIDKPEDEVN